MDIMQKAINSQITFLKNINASFKIQLPDGRVFVHDPNNFFDPEKNLKRHRKNPGVKLGDIKDFVDPFVAPLEPGQSTDIPLIFNFETIRGLVGYYARKNWGRKSYLTHVKPDGDYITVVRIL